MKSPAIEIENQSINVKRYNRAILKTIVDYIKRSHILVLIPIAFLLGKSISQNGGIPFGAIMFCGFYFLKTSKIIIFLTLVLGMFANGYNKYVIINVISIILFMILKKIISLKDKNVLGNALLCTLCITIGEYIFFFREGMLLYDFVKILFHIFLAIPLFYVFKNAGMYLEHKDKYLDISNEEIMSIAIVCAISILGMNTLNVMGLKILDIITTLLICMFSNKFGLIIGTTFGMLLGLITNINNEYSLVLAGIYGISGMISGLFKALGKIGTCLGFLLTNLVLMLFRGGYNFPFIHIKEMIVGMLIFLLLPEKFIEFIIGSKLNGELICWERRNYNFRLKELTVNRLNKFSEAFYKLQKTFSDISEYEFVTDKNDISILFDRVADRVCKNCSLCVYCWDRSFYETYQVMYKIVEMLEAKGRINIEDIPKFFLDRCERVGEFTRALNNIYEIFKVDVVWKNKIAESRKVVSKQLGGLSKVVSDLATEINKDVKFNTIYEEKIIEELNRLYVQFVDVMVYENKWGKYEVILTIKNDDCQKTSSKELNEVINNVMSKKMEIEKEYFDTLENKSVKYIEKNRFDIITGFVKLTKDGEKVSGDSYSLLNAKDGKYYIVLSDGMGSGEKAQKNSNSTIGLFENFIESGFDKETTIKIINSILVLKSNEESFSTLDISAIDLNNLECQFIKVGAMPTFIKTKDEIKEIKYASLPASILNNLEIEPQKESLKLGDYIIMVTDGVVDLIKKVTNGNKKLKDILNECDKLNPQDIAEYVINRACDNGTPMDDMLIIVAKIISNV